MKTNVIGKHKTIIMDAKGQVNVRYHQTDVVAFNVIGNHKTKVFTRDGQVNVRYHKTDVVAFNDKLIVLESGGYRTHTTKKRMNQASDQFGLRYYVFQKDYKWFVDYGGKTVDFEDGMILNR